MDVLSMLKFPKTPEAVVEEKAVKNVVAVKVAVVVIAKVATSLLKAVKKEDMVKRAAKKDRAFIS